jgi:hypothetical protein
MLRLLETEPLREVENSFLAIKTELQKETNLHVQLEYKGCKVRALKESLETITSVCQIEKMSGIPNPLTFSQ